MNSIVARSIPVGIVMLVLTWGGGGWAQDLISIEGGPLLSGTSCPEWRNPDSTTEEDCGPGYYLPGGTYHGINAILKGGSPGSTYQSNVRHHGSLLATPLSTNGADSTGVDFTVAMKFYIYTYISTGAAARGLADARISGAWTIRLHRWCSITAQTGGGGYSGDPVMNAAFELGSRFYGPVTTDGSQTVFRHDEQNLSAITFPSGVYPPGEYQVAVDFTGSFNHSSWITSQGGRTRNANYTTTLTINAVEVAPPPCGQGGPCPSVMDPTGDGQVTVADVAAWYEMPFDTDGDSLVNEYDLHLLALEAGIDLEDCDGNAILDAVDIFLHPCWDEDLDGQIDYCFDPQAPHDMQCGYPPNLYVGPAGTDDNTAAPDDPLGTIAFALSMAAVGDTVSILPGHYTETGLTLADGVVIRGAPSGTKTVTPVVLDAELGGSIFIGSNLSGVVLEGLTLVRSGSQAVLVDSTALTLKDCHFEDNNGAVNCSNGSLVVQSSEFKSNHSFHGGAINAFNSGISIFDSLFRNNQASQDGGAVYTTAPGVAQIRDSRFIDNQAPDGSGGAVLFNGDESIYLEIRNCDFVGNGASHGAAIHLGSTSNQIDPQYATDIFECLFAGNSGSEVLKTSSYSTRLWENTFTHSSAAFVIDADNDAEHFSLHKCLITDNDAQAVTGSVEEVTSCNIFANTNGDYVGPLADRNDGVTNFLADPLYCDPDNGDYSLDSMSPCLVENSPLTQPAQVGSEGWGCGAISHVADRVPPSRHTLDAAVPNPFNPSTVIRFSLASSENVSLQVFDLAGRVVRTLVAGEVLAAGLHDYRWDGLDVAGQSVSSGIYLYRLRAGKFTTSRRMMMLK